MSETKKKEIERKFLIKYPDTAFLASQQLCRVMEIEQTYLLCDCGSLRVRKSVCGGKTEYIRNLKNNGMNISRDEDEKNVSEETFRELLLCADGERNTVFKTRYAFPFENHTMEVDVYPFWNDRAILEVELKAEDEQFGIPDYIGIIKEVTNDKRYSNRALAKEIITEEL